MQLKDRPEWHLCTPSRQGGLGPMYNHKTSLQVSFVLVGNIDYEVSGYSTTQHHIYLTYRANQPYQPSVLVVGEASMSMAL